MTPRPMLTALGLIFTLGAAAGVTVPAPASAQSAMNDRNVFDLMDRNDDGLIDAEEVRTGSETWFLAYDRDGDGQVTRDELAGSEGGGSDASRLVLADLDADGDGAVSREEFMAAHRGYYDEVAAGGDVTTRDYTERVSERDDPLVPDVDEDEMVSEDEAAADWERSFWAMDLDGDDALSEEEWPGDAEGAPAFSELDADQDQTISRWEYMEHGRQQYRAARERLGTDQVAAADYMESTRWREEAVAPAADLDGDGIITAAEAEAYAESWFMMYDRDRDGILTTPEYDPSQAAVRNMTDMLRDSGGSDVIRQDDYMAYRDRALAEADLDGDGEVTVWEYRAYRQN